VPHQANAIIGGQHGKEIEDTRESIRVASLVKTFAVIGLTVFNIGGNKYRLIVDIDYQRQIIYIKHVLTHADYDKETWKRPSS
jgi:mRNA-degrading endonuclease HigB of HigAB toxin-antitoxin module